jgi:hypothetical protein
MKPFLAAMAIVVSLAPAAALAQERVGDAALGGLSGALVLGPVGAVAGIVIGYTAGPSISRSWGLNRDRPYYVGKSAPRPATARSKPVTEKPIQSASAAPAKPPAVTKPTWDAPPVAGFE